jgi:hypothetical protein
VKTLPDKTDDTEAFAKQLDKAGADFRKIQAPDPALRADLDGVQRDTAELAKVLLDTTSFKLKMTTATTALEAAVAKEKPLNDRVNTMCGLTAPPPKK